MDIEAFLKYANELHPILQYSLNRNRNCARLQASRVKLENFTRGDFVLVSRADFQSDEKLALHWLGPRHLCKAINDRVSEIEDLLNGQLDDVHASRLKFYSDSSLDVDSIFPIYSLPKL